MTDYNPCLLLFIFYMVSNLYLISSTGLHIVLYFLPFYLFIYSAIKDDWFIKKKSYKIYYFIYR